jgi:hypothetical protein
MHDRGVLYERREPAAVRAAITAYVECVTEQAPERAREILARTLTPLTLRRAQTPGAWSVSGAIRRRGVVSANLRSETALQ